MKLATRIIALTLIMLPLLASAQLGTQNKIVSNVPFEFTIGNKIMPAGAYSMQVAATETRLAIQSDKAALYSNFVLDESKKTAGDYALVFHRYGDRTFLTGIELAGSATVYRLPESRAEAELQARNTPSVETTLVASLR